MKAPRGTREDSPIEVSPAASAALTPIAGRVARPERATDTAPWEHIVADFWAIAVTAAVFAILALIVRGVEKL